MQSYTHFKTHIKAFVTKCATVNLYIRFTYLFVCFANFDCCNVVVWCKLFRLLNLSKKAHIDYKISAGPPCWFMGVHSIEHGRSPDENHACFHETYESWGKIKLLKHIRIMVFLSFSPKNLAHYRSLCSLDYILCPIWTTSDLKTLAQRSVDQDSYTCSYAIYLVREETAEIRHHGCTESLSRLVR